MGREALERQRREGITRRLAGFEMKGAGIPRPGYAIFQGETQVGQVTSGTTVSGRAIGMGYVPPQTAKPGMRIAIEIHNRKVDAEIVKLPFYRRPKQ
jgi:aminomethyltransferase